MSFLDRIAECNRFDRDDCIPVRFASHPKLRLGVVREARAEELARRDPSRARCVDGCLELAPGADTEGERTRVLDEIVAGLVEREELSRRYGEAFDVIESFGRERVAQVDRIAMAWFGFHAYGVHINGFVRQPDGGELSMWVATRARGKSTFPGMLDNMVAGGQPSGLSARDNVIKECAEEAGVPADLARQARAVGAVSYCVEHPRGLKPDTMFCYDLELPPDFVPRAVDGEVDSFALRPLTEVAEIVQDSNWFKFNCNLVIIDFLVRHGWLGPDDPDYLAIVRGLDQPLDLDGLG